MNLKIKPAALCLAVLAMVAGSAIPAAAQFNNRRPARPEVALPLGPVREVILGSCTACHGIDEYAYYALDRAGWDQVVERMKTTPSGLVEGAVISDPDKTILLDWLVEQFGPDSTPFPREYVPRVLSEADYLSDEGAEAKLAGACESCHTLERVEETRASEDEWRAILLDMIGRGAPLPISDVEPLVEWLERTRGTNPTN
jgi:cytochrome c553